MLTIALPRGKLLKESAALFHIDPTKYKERSKLIIQSQGLKFILLKPWDVPIYVEEGVADMGICGEDIIEEEEPDVFVPYILPFGKCRLVLASLKQNIIKDKQRLKIATKYVNITSKFLANSGEVVKPEVEILPLRGSIEVAGKLKLADCIVDLVVTGKTLAAHNLLEIQHIKSYSAVVLVNKAAIKLKGKRDLLLKILEEYIVKNSV